MRADKIADEIDRTLKVYGIDPARRRIIRAVLCLRLSLHPRADARAEELNDEINARQAVDAGDEKRDSNLA